MRGVVAPSRGVVAPSLGVVAPSRGVVAHSLGVVAPSRGVVAPSRGVVAPSRGVVAHSLGVVAPSREDVAPSREDVAPSREDVAPSREDAPLSGIVVRQPAPSPSLRGEKITLKTKFHMCKVCLWFQLYKNRIRILKIEIYGFDSKFLKIDFKSLRIVEVKNESFLQIRKCPQESLFPSH